MTRMKLFSAGEDEGRILRGASHELKTPLASLKILIENMKEMSGVIRIETTIWELP